MKKVFAAMLAGALILTACGGGESQILRFMGGSKLLICFI